MNGTNMVWLVNRLRCMSVAEMGYRVQQATAIRLGRSLAGRTQLALARSAPPAVPTLNLGVRGAPELDPGEVEALLLDAERICAGHVVLFADGRFDVGVPTAWNRDPDTRDRAGRVPGRPRHYRPRTGGRHQACLGTESSLAPRASGTGLDAHARCALDGCARAKPAQLA